MNFRLLILAVCAYCLFACESDSHVREAQKDAEAFLKNVRTTERLVNHPMLEPEGIPASLAMQNKKRNLEGLKTSVNELCGKITDFNLVNTFKKLADNGEKFIYLEYEYCKEITFVMGYAVKRDEVILHGIWPMNKEDRPADMFQKEVDWK